MSSVDTAGVVNGGGKRNACKQQEERGCLGADDEH